MIKSLSKQARRCKSTCATHAPINQADKRRVFACAVIGRLLHAKHHHERFQVSESMQLPGYATETFSWHPLGVLARRRSLKLASST